ncbi:hypothetical protein GDO81_010212 [Engystomops pustulosus]|uniref:Uncharacterized protein n=1 Tax=Engystomops pustulosus TaxID=76066 RepID=A0AAV7BYK6_ENGPU|nr:hypothetical protein GDO81_010212 [Engystomops pustulosus]
MENKDPATLQRTTPAGRGSFHRNNIRLYKRLTLWHPLANSS